ncbi:MAG TPA: hypothetical protein VIP05_12090, partial [Burkholderiaceae bacterium]
RMGGLVAPRVRFRGHDLHAQLRDADWLDVWLLGLTGRRFEPAQLRLLQALWVVTSYPDARIWNNRVVGLAGSARSTGGLAFAAGCAISEAHIYGRGIEMQAVDFFLRTRRSVDAGVALEDCVAAEIALHGRVAGYGRPLLEADERIEPFMALARELGLHEGPHLRLAGEVEAVLRASGKPLRMNYGAIVCSIAADLGFTARQFTLFMFPAFLAGMGPCYVEATERPEGTLFPLPVSHLRFDGREPRRWTDRER